MKVITMESSAYKEMMAQIANIAGYIREARDEKKRKRETEDKLLDTAQAAKMLNVSKRTMQRMRTDHRIEYVVVRGLDAEADGTARPSGRTAAGDEG